MQRFAFLVVGALVGCSGGAITGPEAEQARSESDTGAPSSNTDPVNESDGDRVDESDSTPAPVEDAAPVDTAPSADLVEVKDLSISELAIFQGVKVSLAKEGVKSTSTRAPVIAGRPALLRVYVAPAATFVSREVEAELTLEAEGATPKIYHAKKTVSGASSDTTLTSTINLELPADAIANGARYRVRLLTAPGQSGSIKEATYPASGLESLNTLDTGTFKLTLVPVKANGYLPDTSPEQIERYRSILQAMYPVSKIELKVRDVWAYTGYIGPGGTGISTLLGAVQSLRKSDGAPADVYYYGLVAPTSTRSVYCAGGCTTGICSVPGPSDTFLRACVGVGFTGVSSAGTLAHELGHAHGIYHAPCGGARGPDSSFPYTGGKIGTWGYDARTSTLIDPTKTADFMGYCSPDWVSDYAFGKLAKRMSSIAAAASIVPGKPMTYQFVHLEPTGKLAWGSDITLNEAMFGEPHVVSYRTADGTRASVTGYFYPYADEGGAVLVPKLPIAARDIEIELDGAIERRLPALP